MPHIILDEKETALAQAMAMHLAHPIGQRARHTTPLTTKELDAAVLAFHTLSERAKDRCCDRVSRVLKITDKR